MLFRSVLAVTGDPPIQGADERVTGVFDCRSFELMRLLEGFNQGRNPFGDDMRQKTRFCIGGALNPNTKNIAMQVRRMERKMAQGASYFLTQPVYSVAAAERVLDATAHLDAPVFLGVMPLASHRNAEFLHNEFPGISIPDDVRERMRTADDGAAEGLEIAWELVAEVWGRFAGVYVMPPFNRYRTALELLRRIRALE